MKKNNTHTSLCFSTLHTAFYAVRNNRGCAGTDGITIRYFEDNLELNLRALEDELHRQAYFPLPLLRILVAKKNGEPRSLCIPAVRDRIVQKAALKIVEPVLEKEFEDCSYAYRKGRSVRQVAYQIKEFHHQGYHWAVRADIDEFFDSIDHALLMEKFDRLVSDTNIRKLVRTWLKAEIWDGTSLTFLEKGVPQGSPISPILSNLYLDELDVELMKAGHKYVRYADDYAIFCKSRKKAAEALALSKEILARLFLRLDEEEILTFREGFKYLGILFLGDLIMKPFGIPKKKNKVLSYPERFDIESYLRAKRKSENSESLIL